jgi:PAS domain S-box-containing protein
VRPALTQRVSALSARLRDNLTIATDVTLPKFSYSLITGLALVLLGTWSFGGYEIYRNKQTVIERAETARAYQAQAFAESTLSSIKRLNEILLDLRDDWSGDWKAFSERVRIRQEHFTDIAFQLAIIDSDGYLAYSNLAPAKERVYLGEREHFTVHKLSQEDRLFISKPLKGKVSGKWSVQFTRPIISRGEFKGVIVASVSPDALVQFHSKLGLTALGTSSIVRDAGEIMARNPNGDKFAGEKVAVPTSEAKAPVAGTFRRVAQLDNVERIFGYYKLPEFQMTFLVAESVDELLQEHYRYRWTVIAAMTLTSMVFIAVFGLLLRAFAHRERASVLLKESLARQRVLASAVEQTPEAIVVTNLAGDIEFVNEAFTLATGYSAEEAKGKNSRILKSGLHTPEMYQQLWGALTTGKSWQGELQNRRKDGELFWESATISPVKDDHGFITNYVAVKANVTEKKQRETELRFAKEEAESANLAKSQFLATMSHEIRTPMNGILGMAQMLLMPNTDAEEREEYARTIISSGNTLLALLNDILDLSKVEAGKLELAYSVFSPADMLNETSALFAAPARNKGLRISVQNRCPMDQSYRGDQIRLRQMVSNLVSNAIKFTDTGVVEIDVVEESHDEQTATLRFAVSDSGIGIPAEKQALLFQPFSQVDSSNKRKFGGTGLGLSIVRRLAELMSGQVGVTSVSGNGSTFWFSVRVEKVSTAQIVSDADTISSPMKVENSRSEDAFVMVVEDTLTNQIVIEAMLNKNGFSSQSFSNGRLAFEAYANGLRPSVILMDCQMPEMDGFEATEAIRCLELEHGLGRTPIVALTADAFQENRKRCLSAGMDDYLTKPVDFDRLRDTLLRWQQVGSAPSA